MTTSPVSPEPRDDQTRIPAQPGHDTTTGFVAAGLAGPPRHKRRWPWIAAAVAVMLLAGAGITWAVLPSTEDEAVEHCHAAIRDKLYSPSTAVFADDVRQNNTPPVFRILGELDAQNKFGGTLRGEYICVLRHEDDGSWVTIDAKVMTR